MMAETSGPAGRGSREPVGIAIRLIAFAVDIFIVKFAFLIAVVGLSMAANERIRLDNPVLATTACSPAAAVPEGLQLPDEFEPTSARRCTSSSLFLLQDHRLVVSGRSKDGELVADAYRIPIDKAGRATPALILDWLVPPALAIYLILSEWYRGTTLAKWFVARLVRTTAGAAISLSQAVVRSVLRLAVLLVIPVSTSLYGPEGQPWRMRLDLTISSLGASDSWAIIVWQAVALGFIMHLAYASFARRPPLHDLFSGTKVIREFPA